MSANDTPTSSAVNSDTTASATATADAVDYSGYYDPNQYYYGYDYSTGSYTGATAADGSTTYAYDPSQYDASQYDASQYDASQYSYDTTYDANYYAQYYASAAAAATATASSATAAAQGNNTTPSRFTPVIPTAAGHSNTPPVTISTSGYTGPKSVSATGSPAEKEEKKKGKKKNMVRAAGGEVWEDPTLLEWEDNDFRLFAGDLGNEVTDELLFKTFQKYPSLQRTRVVRDKRTGKSKGFGFISFKDPNDFVKAWREMNGKYVGNRPIKLRKSTWKERNMDVRVKKERERMGPYSKLR
ncbi:uncharacterized protein BYT42DRAFT_564744 [Radiomyces spectabilis]|uniref:uncharacterized protein n=1 Tax=Radiomyces spectabilis TaxID=64574 RepID=UPI00221F240B|nr:uncharacterized protein BYT42DRAFT_564744 [Radiomyces spectabilis]KAI8380948.1 hypothetical protein BYT42DRAFT_564744 [Radiomyces spectabilis]